MAHSNSVNTCNDNDPLYESRWYRLNLSELKEDETGSYVRVGGTKAMIPIPLDEDGSLKVSISFYPKGTAQKVDYWDPKNEYAQIRICVTADEVSREIRRLLVSYEFDLSDGLRHAKYAKSMNVKIKDNQRYFERYCNFIKRKRVHVLDGEGSFKITVSIRPKKKIKTRGKGDKRNGGKGNKLITDIAKKQAAFLHHDQQYLQLRINKQMNSILEYNQENGIKKENLKIAIQKWVDNNL